MVDVVRDYLFSGSVVFERGTLFRLISKVNARVKNGLNYSRFGVYLFKISWYPLYLFDLIHEIHLVFVCI